MNTFELLQFARGRASLLKSMGCAAKAQEIIDVFALE
jgi:hypothetical protein